MLKEARTRNRDRRDRHSKIIGFITFISILLSIVSPIYSASADDSLRLGSVSNYHDHAFFKDLSKAELLSKKSVDAVCNVKYKDDVKFCYITVGELLFVKYKGDMSKGVKQCKIYNSYKLLWQSSVNFCNSGFLGAFFNSPDLRGKTSYAKYTLKEWLKFCDGYTKDGVINCYQELASYLIFYKYADDSTLVKICTNLSGGLIYRDQCLLGLYKGEGNFLRNDVTKAFQNCLIKDDIFLRAKCFQAYGMMQKSDELLTMTKQLCSKLGNDCYFAMGVSLFGTVHGRRQDGIAYCNSSPGRSACINGLLFLENYLILLNKGKITNIDVFSNCNNYTTVPESAPYLATSCTSNAISILDKDLYKSMGSDTGIKRICNSKEGNEYDNCTLIRGFLLSKYIGKISLECKANKFCTSGYQRKFNYLHFDK